MLAVLLDDELDLIPREMFHGAVTVSS